jgi:hypothetical protein
MIASCPIFGRPGLTWDHIIIMGQVVRATVHEWASHPLTTAQRDGSNALLAVCEKPAVAGRG